VTVTDVFVHGPEMPARVISVETSTPKARAFIEKFLNSPSLSKSKWSLTSRELRAVLSDSPPADLTFPMSEPFPDIIQDLGQLSHLTASYLGRATAGAILLALGILGNDPMAIVVAALFLPFLSQVLAISFGIWSRDSRLALRGAEAVSASTVLALVSGALVAWIEGGPIAFSAFKSPLESFVISAVIGTTAALSCADDAGRRYLIGVAAAVQFAIFPVWFGAALVLGLPASGVVAERMLSFFINLVTISASAAIAYAVLHLKSSGGWRSPRRERLQS
jgi:uncharacterized membrane protein